MDNLRALQLAMHSEIANERNAEMEAIQTAEKEASKSCEKKVKMYNDHFKGLEMDVEKNEAYNRALTDLSDTEIKKIQEKLGGGNAPDFMISPEEMEAESIDSSLIGGGNHIVYPSSVQAFSTQEDSPDAVAARTVVNNGSTQNRWNWAKGAGSGISGTGAASNTQWVEFGFWFKPTSSRVYSIVPRNVFRGYYIVKADDEWFNSKYAKASVDVWINVKQYNWKGWSKHNVMTTANDNINKNSRLDTNRSHYHSALLGGGDWAFIRVAVRMYVYARGGGSYAELNFATGNANYLKTPYCIIN
ncbi:hypothetical protein ACFFU1_09780 [Algibacter miyuki]|uniref:Uncharacterized protein n=1 Tax=Algibacter miyuki TaxID=1306933 RepID=A0ABV5GZX6_9FLAO|nr:hypothetical protein [Algibacter miyuki]MDN3666613.1 hypothetical protein [Algibacter miyuki]